jgi:hypothetical protein
MCWAPLREEQDSSDSPWERKLPAYQDFAAGSNQRRPLSIPPALGSWNVTGSQPGAGLTRRRSRRAEANTPRSDSILLLEPPLTAFATSPFHLWLQAFNSPWRQDLIEVRKWESEMSSQGAADRITQRIQCSTWEEAIKFSRGSKPTPELTGCRRISAAGGSRVRDEVSYGTQYDLTVVRSYYRFFSLVKMMIWQMYIIWKKIPRCPSYYLIHFIYFISYITTIPFYIFNNTLILPIGPLNSNIRQLKK